MGNVHKDTDVLYQELMMRRACGRKFMVRELSDSQLNFVRNTLELDVQPIFYQVATMKIPAEFLDSYLLKVVNHAFASGSEQIYMRLTKKDAQILKRVGIKFHVARYRIELEPAQ